MAVTTPTRVLVPVAAMPAPSWGDGARRPRNGGAARWQPVEARKLARAAHQWLVPGALAALVLAAGRRPGKRLRSRVQLKQGSTGTTIEMIYQKKTQREHVLLRPDTYVGTTQHVMEEQWVVDPEAGEFELREIDYVPALYKIFDEIIVNAADNKVRDPKQDLISVDLDIETGYIVVLNSGRGIPIEMHKKEGCYVPELVMGHLLTSNNFNDTERKITGGRNGYGAKLTNIFSTHFLVETMDAKKQLLYSQEFSDNMSVKEEPVIVKQKGQKDYTRVSFLPDYETLGMDGLDQDIVSLMMKRCYDLAATTGCKVCVNGKDLDVHTFQDYVQLYADSPTLHGDVEFASGGKRWQIAVGVSDGTFQQVSFVNSICTSRGGTHVNHVMGILVAELGPEVQKRLKKSKLSEKVTRKHIADHIFLFVKCHVENPAFSSQTKEELTLKEAHFGSACKLPASFLKKLKKSPIVTRVVELAMKSSQLKLEKALSGKKTKRTSVEKLEDARLAGTNRSQECTLILCEGDSAKSNAVAGLGAVGRERFGVYPLRGKLLNVRTASAKQKQNNKVLNHIAKAMGLHKGASSLRDLRYGSIMLMCDQDHDGSHIKGLVINFLQQFWPQFVETKGFLKEFRTPLVKVELEKRTLSFYSNNDFEVWKSSLQQNIKFETKYLKGLGTSTDRDMREYFKDLPGHTTVIVHRGDEEDAAALSLAFTGAGADERKAWIAKPWGHRDYRSASITVNDFVNQELVHFSRYDCSRAIPSMVDGLKTVQRKILYCMLAHRKKKMKLPELIGLVSKEAHYHHGDAALGDSIVKMAQTFVGANNINLLVPDGQFGTREQNGQNAAKHRYLYTKLSDIVPKIFIDDDYQCLARREDEGRTVEPEWFCPIVPMALINGQQGIGTGWATGIPNHSPFDVIENLRRLLRGDPVEPMTPWYRGFQGEIRTRSSKDAQAFETVGKVVSMGRTGRELKIHEVPVGMAVETFREKLAGMPGVKEVKLGDTHDNRSIEIHVEMLEDVGELDDKVLKKLHLLKNLSLMNYVLFDEHGEITKYHDANHVLEAFFEVRMGLYAERKAWLLRQLRALVERLKDEERYVTMAASEPMAGRPSLEVLDELRDLGFRTIDELNAYADAESVEETASKEAEVDKSEETQLQLGFQSFEHLLGKSQWSLTLEAANKLRARLDRKLQELGELEATSEEELYEHELDELEAALHAFYQNDQ